MIPRTHPIELRGHGRSRATRKLINFQKYTKIIEMTNNLVYDPLAHTPQLPSYVHEQVLDAVYSTWEALISKSQM